jgi:hypothetical protein
MAAPGRDLWGLQPSFRSFWRDYLGAWRAATVWRGAVRASSAPEPNTVVSLTAINIIYLLYVRWRGVLG